MSYKRPPYLGAICTLFVMVQLFLFAGVNRAFAESAPTDKAPDILYATDKAPDILYVSRGMGKAGMLAINFSEEVAPLSTNPYEQLSTSQSPVVTPFVAGNWRWQDGSRLVFAANEPKRDFIPGRTFSVSLKDVPLRSRKIAPRDPLAVTLPPLQLTNLSCYWLDMQREVPPARQFQVNLAANYPIYVPSLQGTSMQLGSRAAVPHGTSGDTSFIFNVTGTPLVLPPADSTISFSLEKGYAILYGKDGPRAAHGGVTPCTNPLLRADWIKLEEAQKVTASGISATLGEAPEDNSLNYPIKVDILSSSSDSLRGPAGKEVSEGIVLQPPHRGIWRFSSDEALVFTPEEPFTPGEEVTISVSAFPGVEIAAPLSTKIEIPRPSLTITESSIVTDPVDPKTRRLTATIELSHPFLKGSLESRTQIEVRFPDGKASPHPIPFEITYDISNSRRAYLKSQPIAVRDDRGTASLVVWSGVQSFGGGAGTADSSGYENYLPSFADIFQVSNATSSEIISSTGSVERILALTTSQPIDDINALSGNLSLKLLPDCSSSEETRPAICKEKEVVSWSDPREVDSRVEEQSESLAVSLKKTEEPERTTHLFSFSAPEKREVLVTVKKGVVSRGDFPLSADARLVVSLGRLKRELKIMHEGALLSFSGDKKLGLTSRGVSDVRVGLRRIPPNNAALFAALSGGDFSNPGLTIDLESLAEEFSYDDNLSSGIRKKTDKKSSSDSPDKASVMQASAEMGRLYSFVDFSKFLSKGKSPRGLFILTVRSKAELPQPPDVSRLDERDAERALAQHAERIKRVEACQDTTTSDSDEESESSDASPLCDQRLVLVTDLGLVAKRNARNEQNLFVMSFRTGKPVAGATVSLLGKNGVPLFSERSSPTGQVTFPSTDTFINEKEPTTYTVTHDGDFSFLPFSRSDRLVNLSRFDTGGVRDSEEFNSLQGFLFSDRGIYRPGDQVRLGMILRKKGWQPLPAGLPLELSITDSRNKEVFRQPISFDQTGFTELRWDTNPGGATGTYRAALHLFSQKINDRLAQVGGTSFRVDEFQPDRLAVKTEIVPATSSTFVNQRDARALVTVRNLFGSPAVGSKASAEITVRPWSGLLPAFPQYRFRRTKREDLPTSAEKLGEQETNEKGETTFALDLEKYKEPIFEFTVAGEGFEKGSGRSVVAIASTIASSLPHLVGFKADGDLDFISKDATRSVELIAVDAGGNRATAGELTATLFEDRYESTLVKQPNGLYAYQSVEKATLVAESPLTIQSAGSKFPLITRDPGRFRLVITDTSKQELLSLSYTVAGEGNVTKSLERNAELTITLDKREYAPESEMVVSIVAPYSGAGLITIESDTVHSHHWFSTTKTASTHRIPVPKELKGNGYLSVAFVRSFDSPDIFMSPLSYGVAPFSVSRAAYTAPIEIKAPAEVVPGTNLGLTLTLGEKSKVVVFAIDEGILQFARYKNPQPLDHFFRKRALQVDTYQILDLILPEFDLVQKLSSTGGDEDSGAGKYKNPFARKHKPPMAFWSGIEERAAGKHEISIPIPDYFSGSVRVLAVSASEARIGTSLSEVLAKGPFIIQPQQPYAVAPGDEFEVGALIGNNTATAELSVSLTTPPHLSVLSENPLRLNLAPGRDTPVRFRVKAGEKLGSAQLGYQVAHTPTEAASQSTGPQTAGRTSFSLSESLSVRPAAPFVVTNTQGRLPVDEQREGKTAEFRSSRALFNELRDVQASVSTTPFGLLRGLVRYLKEYPYGCTEQLVSQSFPALILGKNPEFGFSPEDAEKFVQRLIKTLASRQQDTGAFGLWSRLSDPEPFYSVYATHFLVVARQMGVSVPTYMYDEALRYLREYTATMKYSWSDYGAQAYALYVLGIAGEVVTDKIRRLESIVQDRFGDSGIDGPWVRFLLAASYKVHQLDGDAERWYGQFASEWKKTGLLPWNVGSDPAVLGLYLYITHEHFQGAITDKTFEGYLRELSQEMLKGRMHSFSGSFALLGLGGFWEQFGSGALGSFTLSAQHGEEPPRELALEGYAIKRATVPADDTTLTLKGDGSLQLYYQLMEAGFDRSAATTERLSGIGLTRWLHTADGAEATSLALTDKLIYEITLNPMKPVSDLAVVAIIPGGFEIDLSEEGLARRTSLPVSGASWSPEHIEIQEDRVIFFGDIGSEPKRFAFALKPLTKGRYQVPPLFAEGMYDPEVQYRGVSGTIEVRE